MNFKFIYEGLSKKILFSILTTIQFTICILCIFTAIETITNVNSSINSINKYFNNGKYYKMDSNISLTDLNIIDENTINEDSDTLLEIKTYLENNKNIKFLSVHSDTVLLKKEDALIDTIVMYDPMRFQDTDYIRTQGVYMNENFLEDMNYSLMNGDIKNFRIDGNGDYIPVVLGNVYKDKYKVGDLIESLDLTADSTPKKVNLKVIGILDDDNYAFENGISAKRKSLKNAIICPFNENVLSKDRTNKRIQDIIRIELTNYLSNGYVILNNNESLDEINKNLLNFKFKFQLKDLTESMDEYKDETINSIKPTIYTAIIIILFSIISVIIVMINSIIKDKKEFGINIMVGATMKNIKIRVLGQVFLLLGISSIISAMILKGFDIFKFNLFDFALTIIVMIVALMVISMVIILTLNKYSINDLIRRNE